MTPKEKAIELVVKYQRDMFLIYKNAKQCALIAVDEILNYLISNLITGTIMTYWIEVKQEIEKL